MCEGARHKRATEADTVCRQKAYLKLGIDAQTLTGVLEGWEAMAPEEGHGKAALQLLGHVDANMHVIFSDVIPARASPPALGS